MTHKKKSKGQLFWGIVASYWAYFHAQQITRHFQINASVQVERIATFLQRIAAFLQISLDSFGINFATPVL